MNLTNHTQLTEGQKAKVEGTQALLLLQEGKVEIVPLVFLPIGKSALVEIEIAKVSIGIGIGIGIGIK
jgi:hypothetical protein